MKVEIVTHCHSGPNGQYARLLDWQLWSLRHWKPQADVRYTLCADIDDTPTIDVLAKHETGSTWLVFMHLEKARLLRRAIGRNVVAMSSGADWVWFCDCDYLFGPGCIDALPRSWGDGKLFYPAQTLICDHHGRGDEYIQTEPSADYFASSHFVAKRETKAIGGIQLTPGPIANIYGYCRDDLRHQLPVTNTDKWPRFSDDIAFRKSLGTNGTPIEIPNLFRLRHSTNGY